MKRNVVIIIPFGHENVPCVILYIYIVSIVMIVAVMESKQNKDNFNMTVCNITSTWW